MPSDSKAPQKERPHCFARLDEVFPVGDDGLRHSPERCLVCHCKVECLRTALAGEGGVAVKQEMVDRAYETGLSGFLERWSVRKSLTRKLKKKKPAK